LITSRHQFDALPESFFEGALLKPLSSVDFASKHGGEGLYGEQPPAGQPRNRATRTSHHAAEFVPGSPDAGYFLDGFRDRSGRITAMFARRRLRMHPGKLGNSTFIESVPLRNLQGAIFALEYLLEQMSYRGIFSAEFKYDLRDRTFKRIEINALAVVVYGICGSLRGGCRLDGHEPRSPRRILSAPAMRHVWRLIAKDFTFNFQSQYFFTINLQFMVKAMYYSPPFMGLSSYIVQLF
jgi:hypothetical protein